MSGDATATARLASELRLRSVRYRKRVLQTIVAAGGGHTGGDLSCVDILTVLTESVCALEPLADKLRAFGYALRRWTATTTRRFSTSSPRSPSSPDGRALSSPAP